MQYVKMKEEIWGRERERERRKERKCSQNVRQLSSVPGCCSGMSGSLPIWRKGSIGLQCQVKRFSLVLSSQLLLVPCVLAALIKTAQRSSIGQSSQSRVLCLKEFGHCSVLLNGLMSFFIGFVDYLGVCHGHREALHPLIRPLVHTTDEWWLAC